MQNLKKSFALTWTKEQVSTVNTIEQKYHKRLHLADVQGLKVNKEEFTAQKCREIKAILSSSEFKDYLNIHESN